MNISVFASSSLAELSNYQRLTGDETFQFGGFSIFTTNEFPIGIYQNRSELAKSSIILTNMGIHIVFLTERDYVPYPEIVFASRATEKFAVTEVHLSLINGGSKRIAITGKQGGREDIDAFLRFFKQVTNEFRADGSVKFGRI